MINLHQIARGAVAALHPEETVLLVQSIGQQNVAGRLVPQYAEPFAVVAQIQAMGADELAHVEKTDSTKICRKAWLNEPRRPVAGVVRELARNGDFIRRGDGSWWLVTAVLEDFSKSGWVSVAITRELGGPGPND